MALLQSTTISGSNANTGSLSITGSTMVFPIIESSLTGSFSGSGKMWVNKDSLALQYSLDTSLGTINSPASFMGAWSTGGSLSIARYAQTQGVYGTQNAGLSVGGRAPSFTSTTANEEYNGSAWSTGGALINATHVAGGAGTQNDAFTAGGYQNSGFCSFSEVYNGSAWSAGGTLISITGYRSGAGSGTAGIIFNCSTTTEEFNGATWATGGNIIITGREAVGIGTQNDALSLNNDTGGSEKNFQKYDGVSWSLGNDSTTNHQAGFGAGNNTFEVLLSGGAPETAETTAVEEYNGISWVNSNTLITKQACGASGGSQVAAYIAGGESPGTTTTTQEYTKDFIVPYTTCVWSNSGAMIVPRSQGAAGGTQNAAFVAGGGTPTRVSCNEEWNGNQFSVGGALIIVRSALAGGGTLNAGWVAGGEPDGGTCTEEYNGTSWAFAGALASGGYGKRGGGPQTAAQVVNGTPSRDGNQTYDGTTWSNATSMPTHRGASALTGTCAASIVYGGSDASSNYLNYGITWNGSAWSQTGATNTCARGNQMGGTQNDALSFGGYNPAEPVAILSTEHYDGSAWSVQGKLSAAGKYGQGAATSPAGAVDSFLAGGYYTPAVIGNMQVYSSACSTTLCSNLPVWSGATQMLAAGGYRAGFGTQNAAVVATGYNGSNLNTTEEYDGTTWTAGNTTQCAASYGRSGAGTQNAGLLFGGWPAQNWTEEYDGTNWSTANAMITTAYGRGSTGTQTAALAAGKGPSPVSGATEEYDGTNWSSSTALSTARYSNVTTGTQNDAVTAGGGTPSPFVACTEEYNGSSWSTGGALNIARKDEAGFQMFGEGSYNATYAGGRTPTLQSTNEEYNGSAWSIRPSLPLAISSTTRIGTSTAGLLAGGRTPSYIANVFEYNNTTNTCVGAWSVKSSLSQARYGVRGAGTTSAALAIGGFAAPASLTCTEEYDGSSWSAGGALINAREDGGANGTQNASLYFGGRNTPAIANRSCTEAYDGSAWTAGGALIQTRGYAVGSSGTTNAALAYGGANPAAALTCVEEYDGSSWSTGTVMITARYLAGATGGGTQNSALAMGGYNSPSATNITNIEGWNGTTWSNKSGLLVGVNANIGSVGTGNTSGMSIGGQTPACISCVQEYDGIGISLTTAIPGQSIYSGGAGSTTAALIMGGRISPSPAACSNGVFQYDLGSAQLLGAGLQDWIGKVDFVTE